MSNQCLSNLLGKDARKKGICMTFTDVCLISDDTERLRRFYESVFMVKAEGDAAHCGISLGQFTITIDSVRLLRDSGAFGYVSGQSSANTVLGFDVEDVDREYARLRALGVSMLGAPTTHPWGARSFQFKDPDGNILNFRTVIKP